MIRDDLIYQIETIIEEIHKESFHTDDDLLGWLYFYKEVDLPSIENVQLLNIGIFNGLSGILILFCAYYKINPNKYTLFRKKLLKTIYLLMLDEKEFTHGYAGNISYLYAISLYCNVFKDEESSLAIKNALNCDYKKLFLYKKLDIIDGASGTLLVLISLNKKFMKDNNWNLLIKTFANHLYCTVKEHFLNKKVFYGFAHGYSGIAYALARVYEIYREKKFITLSVELLEKEDDFFSNNDKVYKDEMYTWCNGISGMIATRIFISKLSGYRSLFSLEDFTRKVSSINNKTTHLCCGSNGNKECISLFLAPNNIKYKGNSYPNNLSFFHGKVGIAYVLCKSIKSSLPNINFLTTLNKDL